jgi:integrase
LRRQTREELFLQLVVSAWIVPHIGHVLLEDLSARDIDRLYATLRASGGRGGRPLRGKSVRNVRVTLNEALKDAVGRRRLLHNPMDGLNRPTTDDSAERRSWDIEDLRTFLGSCAGDRLGPIWRLACATGLRRGELLGLRWEDFDDDGRAVTVRRQVLMRGRAVGTSGTRLYVRDTLKGGRARRVRFDRDKAGAMASWSARQAEERLAFGPAWKVDGGLGTGSGWIVTEADGAVVHPDTLYGRWQAAVKAAGVPAIGLHGARHSFAEAALRSGARLDVVSRALGHSSIAVTGNVYLNDNDTVSLEAADLLGTALGEYRENRNALREGP